MLTLQALLMGGGVAMMLAAASILGFDLYREVLCRRVVARPDEASAEPHATERWRTSVALVLLAWGPILLALGIALAPAGIRIGCGS